MNGGQAESHLFQAGSHRTRFAASHRIARAAGAQHAFLRRPLLWPDGEHLDSHMETILSYIYTRGHDRFGTWLQRFRWVVALSILPVSAVLAQESDLASTDTSPDLTLEQLVNIQVES